MRMRGLIVFATIAALVGAPSITSGAGNSLARPSATPTSGTVESDEETHAEARRGLLGLVLMVGLSGVAAVAVIGSALLVVRRRSEGSEAAGAVDGTAEADTEALLQRRIVRRAKVRLGDDPIVAAMGVDDQVDARRRRGAGRPPAGDPRDRPPRGRP